MKLGIHVGYIKKYGFNQGIKLMKEQGYDCIDYNLADTTTGLYLVPDENLKEEVLKIKDAIDNVGLIISQTHGPWRWPPKNLLEEDLKERFEKMRKSIEITHTLNCKNWVIHPIMPYDAEEGPTPNEVWDRNYDFFKKLLPVAIDNDVTICFENMPMPNLKIGYPQKILEFAKLMNSPNFKVCLDTGHSIIDGMEPGKAVRLIGKDYLRVLHIHDNDGKNDIHLMPYKGVIDWEDFSNALQEIGFDGCASLETYIPKNTEEQNVKKEEEYLFNSIKKIAKR